MYHQNASPPNQQQQSTSPSEVQREALNLQRESPSPIPPPQSPIVSIKREREQNDVNDYHVAPKRGFIRSDLDMNRKNSINNNHHLIKNNNNPPVTPTKVNNMSKDRRSQSPCIDNDIHADDSPSSHNKQQNGLDTFGSMMMNGMQFKIVSKGEMSFALFLNEF